jgi:hypothetical protein
LLITGWRSGPVKESYAETETEPANPLQYHFAAQFSLNGKLLWTKRFAPNRAHFLGFSVMPAHGGGTLLAGELANQDAAALLKINEAGDIAWQREIPSTWDLHWPGYGRPPVLATALSDGSYLLARSVKKDMGDYQWLYDWEAMRITDSAGPDSCLLRPEKQLEMKANLMMGKPAKLIGLPTTAVEQSSNGFTRATNAPQSLVCGAGPAER